MLFTDMYQPLDDPKFLDETPIEIKGLIEKYSELFRAREGSALGEEYSIIFLYCPYCRATDFGVKKYNRGRPESCKTCGRTDPYQKLYDLTLSKATYLCNLYQSQTPNNDSTKKVNRAILEQSIVILATSFEVYLRDMYATTLNRMFIKSDKDLLDRFYSDSRNTFTNYEKAKDAFKKEPIKINFKAAPKNKNFNEQLTLLLLKRNAIVHNAGIADDTFVKEAKKAGLEVEKGKEIPINVTEIYVYSTLVGNVAYHLKRNIDEKLKEEYFSKLEPCLIREIERLSK
jgi:transposase-like protein